MRISKHQWNSIVDFMVTSTRLHQQLEANGFERPISQIGTITAVLHDFPHETRYNPGKAIAKCDHHAEDLGQAIQHRNAKLIARLAADPSVDILEDKYCQLQVVAKVMIIKLKEALEDLSTLGQQITIPHEDFRKIILGLTLSTDTVVVESAYSGSWAAFIATLKDRDIKAFAALQNLAETPL